tara:strand:- start:2158 stop:3255 length:1098 start_codon:yes stop_codon:yes gene_type:complete
LKIFFIEAHSLDTQTEGVTTYTKNIFYELIKSNQKTIFYLGAQNIKNLKKVFGEFENVRFIKYKFKSTFLRNFYEIPQIFRNKNFTHAHFNYIVPFFLSKKIKRYVTLHDILYEDFPQFFPIFYRILRSFFFRRSAKIADHIFTVSKYSKKRISKVYDIKESMISIVPNAISDDFKNFNISKEDSRLFIKKKYNIKKYLLYVSRIEERKNHKILIDIFCNNEILQEKYQLVFIGKDSLKTSINSEIENSKNIFWLKFVNFNDLLHFYNGAQLFVFPSICEGFGIPPLEAAVMKTPTLCSNATAMNEFDFFENLSFDPNNIIELEHKINKTIKSNISDKSNNIANIINNRFSWKKSAEIIKNIANL